MALERDASFSARDHSNYAMALQGCLRSEEAITAFSKALDMAPANNTFVFNLAACYLNDDQAEEAKDLFINVIKQDSKNLEASIGLGIAQIKLLESA